MQLRLIIAVITLGTVTHEVAGSSPVVPASISKQQEVSNNKEGLHTRAVQARAKSFTMKTWNGFSKAKRHKDCRS